MICLRNSLHHQSLDDGREVRAWLHRDHLSLQSTVSIYSGCLVIARNPPATENLSPTLEKTAVPKAVPIMLTIRMSTPSFPMPVTALIRLFTFGKGHKIAQTLSV